MAYGEKAPDQKSGAVAILLWAVLALAVLMGGIAVAVSVSERDRAEKCCTRGRSSDHAARVWFGCASLSNRRLARDCQAKHVVATPHLINTTWAILGLWVVILFAWLRSVWRFLSILIALLLFAGLVWISIGWIEITGRTSCFPPDFRPTDPFPSNSHECTDATRASTVYRRGLRLTFHATTHMARISSGLFGLVLGTACLVITISTALFFRQCIKACRRRPTLQRGRTAAGPTVTERLRTAWDGFRNRWRKKTGTARPLLPPNDEAGGDDGDDDDRATVEETNVDSYYANTPPPGAVRTVPLFNIDRASSSRADGTGSPSSDGEARE